MLLVLLAWWRKCRWSAMSLYFLVFAVLGLRNTNKIKFHLLSRLISDGCTGI